MYSLHCLGIVCTIYGLFVYSLYVYSLLCEFVKFGDCLSIVCAVLEWFDLLTFVF